MDKVEINMSGVSPPIVVEKERIADPGPLGLAAFALTTFVLSAHNAGWAQNHIWLGLGFFYGGLCQLLAGMWEFKRNNTFAATAFTTYAGFWMGLAMTVLLELLGVFPDLFDLHNALGWYLGGFLIFNSCMTVVALLMSAMVLAVFVLLEITILAVMVGNFTGVASWTIAGGYFGIFTSIAAFYTSFANCFNAHAGKAVIFVGKPMLRFVPE